MRGIDGLRTLPPSSYPSVPGKTLPRTDSGCTPVGQFWLWLQECPANLRCSSVVGSSCCRPEIQFLASPTTELPNCPCVRPPRLIQQAEIASQQTGHTAVKEVLDHLRSLVLAAKAGGIPCGSRPVPKDLWAVLGSHPMIHTAEAAIVPAGDRFRRSKLRSGGDFCPRAGSLAQRGQHMGIEGSGTAQTSRRPPEICGTTVGYRPEDRDSVCTACLALRSSIAE